MAGKNTVTPVEAYLRLDTDASSAESKAEQYRQRAEQNRWEQCRIVYEAVKSGEYSRGGFAKAVGKSQSTISYQFQIADRWGHLHEDERLTYTEAWATVFGRASTGPERTRDMHRRGVRNLPTEDKAEVARELLADPEVAEAVEDDIVEHVASDPVRTSHVVSKRREAEPTPAYEPRKPERDYDQMVDRGVNLIAVALAAKKSGRWTPSELSEALLYFLGRQLADQEMPNGNFDDELAKLEAYANSEVS